MYHVRHKRPTDVPVNTAVTAESAFCVKDGPGPHHAHESHHEQRTSSVTLNRAYRTSRHAGMGFKISRKVRPYHLKADETNVSQTPSSRSLPSRQSCSRAVASRRDTIIQVKPVDRRRVPHLARGSPWLRSRPKPIRQKPLRLLDHPRHPCHHMPSHANNTCANHAVSRERSGYLRGAS